MANVLANMQYVQQQGHLGQQQGQNRFLQGLAPQVIAGDPSALAQAAAISPEAAGQYDKVGSEISKRGAGLASYILEAYKDGKGNPKEVEARYQAGLPFLTKLAQLHERPPPPSSFDPASVPAMQQYVAKYQSMMPGNERRNSVVSPGSAIVDPQTGEVVYERPFAPASAQIVKVPDGNGGLIDMVFDPKTRQLSVPQYPGQQSWVAPGEVPFSIDPSLPASVQADIRAREGIYANAQDGETVAPPAQPVSGGQMGYTPPKPAGGQSAPSGYQWAGDGSLTPIAGGPADRKNNPTAADQAKGEMSLRKEVSDRLKQDRGVLSMYQNLQRASSDPSAAGDLSMIFAYMKMLDPGSVVREQEFANAQNAAGVPDQIRNAYNRALNGQRLNPNQRQDFVRQAASIAGNAQQRITKTAREYQDISDDYGYDSTRSTGMADFRNVSSGQRPLHPRGAEQAAPGEWAIEELP